MLPHRMLIDERAIAARVDELAKAVAADLNGRPVLLLGLLTGSFVFMADLARALARRSVDPQVAFLRVSHYGSATDPSRPVEVEQRLPADLAGRAVLVVDEMVDSGDSITAVLDRLRAARPAWLRVCAFLARRTGGAGARADYVGFPAPDGWLIGYGLDLRGEGRALPYVGLVEQDSSD